MKDLVIGCVTNYTFDFIKPWVNSLDRCGFSGDKYVICYDVNEDLILELNSRGYRIIRSRLNGSNIVLTRFIDIWSTFKFHVKDEYRYIISTDVKDVVFQTNPSDWLERNIGNKKINVACESIKYKDEPWGNNNFPLSFNQDIYNEYKNNLIVNAGTISGEFHSFLDLALNLYLICGKSPQYVPGGGGPDQAALNLLLGLEPYKSIVNIAMSESGYAAQLGTTGPQVQEHIKNSLVEPTPVLNNNLVCTSMGVPFSIVHQYDRVPEWKNLMERKYA